jgi:Flp pilus assembly protein TadG
MRRRRDEAGHVVDMAIVTPAVLGIAGMIIAGARGGMAEDAVDAAAIDAARQASIARDQASAEHEAYDAAQASLESQGLDCSSLSVSVDVSGFSTPVGQTAQVSAKVTCRVDWSDLVWVPGLPGGKTVSATESSPLDTYRERGL